MNPKRHFPTKHHNVHDKQVSINNNVLNELWNNHNAKGVLQHSPSKMATTLELGNYQTNKDKYLSSMIPIPKFLLLLSNVVKGL